LQTTVTFQQVRQNLKINMLDVYLAAYVCSPFHCWQPSIFGCCPSGVELPLATYRTQLETFLFTESYPDIGLI